MITTRLHRCLPLIGMIGLLSTAEASLEPPANSEPPATPESSAPSESAPPLPTRRVIMPSDVGIVRRAPLLREGGFLVKVEGEIERDARLGVHLYSPLATATGGIRRELILLPSRGLDDLVRLESVQSTAKRGNPIAGVYEVSGKVLVFQGRNFLLPEAIVPLTRIDETVLTDQEAAPEGGTDGTSATDPAVDSEERDFASEIDARLEARIGAVPRSLDVLAAPPAETASLRAGTRFVQRRGQVVRDPGSGIWRFVLEGNGRKGDAVSLDLLPCLELERLIRRTRQSGIGAPVLLSGVVTIFQGRNYLLPTAVQRTMEGRSIGP
jgi:hypothetical protein